MKVIRSPRFFNISPDKLGAPVQRFPFTLYIYEPQSQRHIPYLLNDYEFNEQREQQIAEIIERGGQIDIALEERRLFLDYFNYTEDEIPGLGTKLNKWQQLTAEREKEFSPHLKEEFSLIDHSRNALNTQDFTPILNRARMEIMLFPFFISPTVSNATFFAKDFLNKDSTTGRVIAYSYFFAKKLRYEQEEELSSVVCAATLRDIGMSQINNQLQSKQLLLTPEEREDWNKHPALSAFLLKKGHFHFSDLTLRIILEHHERFNGTGYPRQKKKEFVHPLSEVLGLFDHIFRLSSGQVTHRKIELEKVIRGVINNHSFDGLDSSFSNQLKEILATTFGISFEAK